MEILCSFRLVLEKKTGKEIPESSKLELLEKFLGNNFALSDAENSTSRPLNGGGIANLPLFNFLIFLLKPSRGSSYLTSAGIYPQSLVPNTMLIQFHYKDYELDL